MLSELEIRKEIERIKEDYDHVLNSALATVDINAPRALMQLSAIAQLDTFYKVLGEKRPRFECEDRSKANY